MNLPFIGFLCSVCCQKLPSNIGFMLSEISNWFCNSDSRRDEYVELFKLMIMDENLDSRNAPLPFEIISTRWLVRGKVLLNILSDWPELTAYFSATECNHGRLDSRCKARLLKQMLLNHKNFLYFTLCELIIREFQYVNALFQHTNADLQKLSETLLMHH